MSREPRMTPRQLQRAVEQAMEDGEELLFAGTMAAVRWFLDHTRRAVLGESGRPDMDAFPPEQAWLDLVVLALNEPIEKVARKAYNRTAVTIGVDANTVEPYIVRHLATVADRLRMWPSGVFDDMRVELAEGFAAAEGIDQLRDRIGAVLDIDAPSRRIRQRLAKLTTDLAAAETSAQQGKVRAKIRKLRLDLTEADRTWHAQARRIARTEATAAANGGAYAAALTLDHAEPGTGIRKQWLATSDDRVRDEHAALNGQTVPLRSSFRVAGEHIAYPGDPAAPPHLTVNCRCTMLIWPGGSEPLELGPIGDVPAASTASAHTEDTMTAATTEAPDAPTAATGLPNGWRGMLAPLGMPSGDGRIIAAPEKLDHRPLPFPLLAQHALDDAHLGAVVIGLHENVWIQDGQLWGEGPLDLADEDAVKWARRLADGYAGGVSVDLDAVTMTMMMMNTATGELSDMPAPDEVDGGDDLLILFGEPELPEGYEAMGVATKWRLMSSTLVSQPAFAEVKIEPVWGYAGPGTGTTTAPDTAPQAQAGEPVMAQTKTTGRFGTPPPPIKSKDGAPAPAEDDGEPDVKLPKVGDRVMVDNPDTGGPGEVTAVDAAAEPPTVTVALDAGGEVTVDADQVRPESEGTDEAGKPKQTPKQGPPPARTASLARARSALVAAAPVKPPLAWFSPPAGMDLSKPAALTITDDGRVYGMLAAWGTCHIGYQDTCVTPPKSNTDYALFHVGEVQCADGTLVPVGKITVGAGHADPQSGFRAATEHYDNTARAVAVVRAHETPAGILVCGAICPDADDTAVAALRRSPLSGDWRRVGGNLELVAALAVNTPGFPVARPRVQLGLAAGGQQLSLVAAGAVMPRTAGASGNVEVVVSKALDEWSRRRARLRVVSERMSATVASPQWARTRAALAQARIDGTSRTVAAVARRHGYTVEG